MKKWMWSGCLAALTAAAWAVPVKGWEFSTPSPASYRWDIDTNNYHSGRASGHLHSDEGHQYAVLAQSVRAEKFLKREIHLTGFMRTQDVQGRAGLFLRMDSHKRLELAFDNMDKNKPVRGTTAWTRYEIALDTPPEAFTIHFGVFLDGSGDVWLDDVNLRALGEALPVAKILTKIRGGPPFEPLNLGFED